MNDLDKLCLEARGHSGKDIAMVSGVSPATVSYVLRKKTNPKMATIEKMRAAIKQLEEQKNGK